MRPGSEDTGRRVRSVIPVTGVSEERRGGKRRRSASRGERGPSRRPSPCAAPCLPPPQGETAARPSDPERTWENPTLSGPSQSHRQKRVQRCVF